MSHYSKFAQAQVDPFADAVKGAKIPEAVTFPTDTAQLETEFLIYPDAAGNFDFAVLPHPLFSVYSNLMQTTTNQHLFLGGPVGGNYVFFPGCANSSEGVISGSIMQFGPQMLGVTNPSLLSKECLSYRVVAVGAKLESLMIPTSATGSLTFCHVPLLAEAPVIFDATSIKYGLEDSELANDATNICTFMGLPELDGLGYFDPSMRQYATGHTINAVEFQQKGIQSSLRIVGDQSTQFRAPNQAAPVFTGREEAEGDDVPQYQGEIVQTSSGSNQSFPASYPSIGGWSSFCCRGTGFPTVNIPGTDPNVPGAVATLRIITLIEYIENPGFSSGDNGFYGGRMSSGSNAGYFRCLEYASKLPFYRSVKLYGTSALRNRVRLGN